MDGEANHEKPREPLFDLADCFAFVGLALIAGGLVMVWVPGALIVPGAILFWLGVRNGSAG